MEKKIYALPQIAMVEIENQQPIANSQFNLTVNNPSEEVDASEALSRGIDSFEGD